MSNWRPEGWRNHYTSGELCSIQDSIYGERAFEQGADAMLEAIRNQMRCGWSDEISDDSHEIEASVDGKRGKFYFIPDEAIMNKETIMKLFYAKKVK